MKDVKHFFYIFALFLTFFLTGCAGQRYHKAVGELSGAPALAGAVRDFEWPLRGRLVLSFGGRENGVSIKGILLEGFEGESVRAARDGKVVWVDEGMRGYGKTLILEHDDVFSTVYARNAQILVSAGQWVKQGQAVARVGRAGKDGVPRSYFEIRKMAAPEDPLQYLR